MKNANLLTSSKRLVMMAALAAGFTLTPFEVMAQAAQVVQQSASIKGQVLDANGEPVIGATVKVKGQPALGALTDIDGNFLLNVAPGALLEVSYIGYKTQSVKATKGMVRITFQEDAQSLNEVVVVAVPRRKST